MTRAMSNSATPQPALRFTSAALERAEGESSANAPANVERGTHDRAPGIGALQDHLIGNSNGEQGHQAQAQRANCQENFAARLSRFGWSVAMLPISLFNMITAGLLAVGDAAVSALTNFFGRRPLANSPDAQACGARVLEPRPVPERRTQIPAKVQGHYNFLVKTARTAGVFVSDDAFKARQPSHSVSLATLEKFVEEVRLDALDAYVKTPWNGDDDETPHVQRAISRYAEALAQDIRRRMYGIKPQV